MFALINEHKLSMLFSKHHDKLQHLIYKKFSYSAKENINLYILNFSTNQFSVRTFNFITWISLENSSCIYLLNVKKII